MNRRSFLGCAAIGAGTAASGAAAALSRNTKITGIETDVLRFPPGKPYSDAIHDFGPERGGVVLRLHTDAGVTGWAYSSFGMIGGGPQVVADILERELKPALIGQDPAFPKRLRAEMWKAVEYNGVQGVVSFALAAADIAIWDILGKMAGLPVYRMLGAFKERMPAYNMCGWYYPGDQDLSEFRRSISAALEEGFRAVKIKVGRSTLDDDVRRIRAAQELCGKDRPVMVDANQKLPAMRRCAAAAYTRKCAAPGTKSRCRRTTSTDMPSSPPRWIFRLRRAKMRTRGMHSPTCSNAAAPTSCSRIIAAQAASLNGWRSQPSPTDWAPRSPVMAAASPTSICCSQCQTQSIWRAAASGATAPLSNRFE